MKNTHRRWVNRPTVARSCRQLWTPRLNPDVQNAYVMQTAQGDRAAPCWARRQPQPAWHDPRSPWAIQPSHCSTGSASHVVLAITYGRDGDGFVFPVLDGLCHHWIPPVVKNAAKIQCIPGLGGDLKPTRPQKWAVGCGREKPEAGGGGEDVCSRACRTQTEVILSCHKPENDSKANPTYFTLAVKKGAAQAEVWWVQAEMNNIFNAFDNENIQPA